VFSGTTQISSNVPCVSQCAQPVTCCSFKYVQQRRPPSEAQGEEHLPGGIGLVGKPCQLRAEGDQVARIEGEFIAL